MKIHYPIKLIVVILMTASCRFSAELPSDLKNSSDENNAKPVVYMEKDITPSGLISVYKALGCQLAGKIAVKISTGEPGGHNYLSPDLIKRIESRHGTHTLEHAAELGLGKGEYNLVTIEGK